MGSVNSFLTAEDYRQIEEETGCKAQNMIATVCTWLLYLYVCASSPERRSETVLF